MEARVSVRGIVEFILRSGDIDNRIGSFTEQAMQEGGRIHRMIQRRAGADYRPEVPLAFLFHGKNVDIRVEGRADGIIENETGVTIDEIKSTYADVMRYKEANPLHLAQVKFYAYIYALDHQLKTIKIRVTYCNIDTEEIRYFNEDLTFDDLETFVTGICTAYEKWAELELSWHGERNASIQGLPFPFPYRPGQEELVRNVYLTICHRKKLFLEAPTGVGKTIATVYPSVCALGQDKAQKIFYLTAKTITRTVAHDSLNLLREKGLQIKSIILTAKEKICMTGEVECNPEACPYAKGHFDRVNDAVYAMLTEGQAYTRETVEEYARRFEVCPFEMALDASLFCDCIIGDYNYAFDPRAKLKRFFGEENTGSYIFLVDEAHNLVDRAREMYSATLVKEEFLEIKKLTETVLPQLSRKCETCNKNLLALKRQCEDHLVNPDIEPFTKSVMRLYGDLENILQEKGREKKKDKVQLSRELRDALLNFYFELFHYLDIYERIDENYVNYCTYDPKGNFYLKLFCVNPKTNLHECMDAAVASVLFSATLLPIQYYKELLAGEDRDYEVYAKSVFDPRKRGLFIADDVTSKYTRRNASEFTAIASYIRAVTEKRHGNYMVFFPSYSFMERVAEAFLIYQAKGLEVVLQASGMKEEEKENFLSRFYEERTEETLIGFCVMGGIFSEGIDLKKDALIGAIIVGTGIPQVCFEQDVIKNFFDQRGENGYDYAYRFPGMNKVLQAAGRVIRTEEDIGIVALLDERFLQNSYRLLFPREWSEFEVSSLDTISHLVERFWDEWL